MPMYGMPAGLLGFLGAGSGVQQSGGFGGALGGALQAFGNASAAQSQGRDRELQGLLDIARLQQEIKGAESKEQERRQAAQQAAKQQQAQQAYVQQLPQELQALGGFAPNVVANQQAQAAFAEPQQPTTLQRNLQAAGLQPGSPEYQQVVMDTLTKRRQGEAGSFKVPANHQLKNPDDPSKGVIPIPGSPADPKTMTTEQRNKAASAQKTHRLLTGQIGDYAKSLSKGIPLRGTGRDKIATQREQIKLQLKNLYDLGAITGPDEEILNRLLIDPMSLTDQALGALPGGTHLADRALSNLDTIMEEADRGLDAALSQGRPQEEQAAGSGLESISTDELLQLYQGLQ